MSTFTLNSITVQGLNVIAKLVAGSRLEFTRIAIGDGAMPSDKTPLTVTDLTHKLFDVDINSVVNNNNGSATVMGVFSNTASETGFFYRELGLFAKDPDTKKEILYCYGNAAADAEWISPAGSSSVIEKEVTIITLIGNAEKVTASLKSGIYATKEDLYNLLDFRHQSTNYKVGDKVLCEYNCMLFLECTKAGTTNNNVLNTRDFIHGQIVHDGTVEWTVRTNIKSVNNLMADSNGNVEIDNFLEKTGGTITGDLIASGYNITATKFIGNLQGKATNADIANMANGSNPDNVFKVQSLNKDIDGHIEGCGSIALCNKENKQLGFSLYTKTYPSPTAHNAGAGSLYVPNKGRYMFFLNASKDDVKMQDLICQFVQPPLIPKRATLNNSNINNSKQNELWDYGIKYYYGYHEKDTDRPFRFYNLLHMMEGNSNLDPKAKSGGGQLAIEWVGDNHQGGLAFRSVTDRNDKDYNWNEWSYPLVRHLGNNIKGTDFNSYTIEAIYNYGGQMTNSYQTNATWGTLVVFNNQYKGASGASGTYLFQSAYCTDGRVYTRYRTNADNWSKWTSVAMFNDQNHLLMPNGAEFWIE